MFSRLAIRPKTIARPKPAAMVAMRLTSCGMGWAPFVAGRWVNIDVPYLNMWHWPGAWVGAAGGGKKRGAGWRQCRHDGHSFPLCGRPRLVPDRHDAAVAGPGG